MKMPGPQRRHVEGVPVSRQPDALQPDDEHEHQATAAEGAEEAGEHAGGEGPDLEELQAEHRLVGVDLNEAEQDEERHADTELRQDHRVGPPHRVVSIGLDPVGDPDHHQDQPDGEGDVARTSRSWLASRCPTSWRAK